MNTSYYAVRDRDKERCATQLTLLPWEPQERQDERKEAALDEAPQDALLLRRVGRVPRVGLASEPTDQHRLLVAEAVEAELAMVRPRAAVAHAPERQMRVRQLQNVIMLSRRNARSWFRDRFSEFMRIYV